MKQEKKWLNYGIRILGIFGVLFALYAVYWGITNEIFTSEAALEEFLMTIGPIAPILFIFIQTTQTITPFIPAALIIPIGLFVFGISSGLFLSFMGLTIGSVINFSLARKFGKPLVEMLVSEKRLKKYMGWIEENDQFDRLFAFGMFFPFTPSDFLTYLAGLSDISFKKYLSITSLSKIFTLFLYAYGVMELLQLLIEQFS